MSSIVTAGWIAAGAASHQAYNADKAAGTAERRTRNWRLRAIENQEQQYAQTREDFAPWRESGVDALNQLSDPSKYFETSPGYDFRRSEGTRNLENVFSAKGGGGNAMRALSEWNQNLASNEFGNWWNRQSGRAGLGQTATQNTSYAGMNAANNISNQYGQIGDNLASIGMWGNNQQTNAMNSGISNWLYSQGGT